MLLLETAIRLVLETSQRQGVWWFDAEDDKDAVSTSES